MPVIKARGIGRLQGAKSSWLPYRMGEGSKSIKKNQVQLDISEPDAAATVFLDRRCRVRLGNAANWHFFFWQARYKAGLSESIKTADDVARELSRGNDRHGRVRLPAPKWG